MEQYLVYISPPLFTIMGFIVRFIWDLYTNRRKREIQEKIKILEYRLKEFYYPIFFYLKREQIIWDKILNLHKISHKTSFAKNNSKIIRSRNTELVEVASVFVEKTQKCVDNNCSTHININTIKLDPINVEILENNYNNEDINHNLKIVKALDEENLKIHKAVQQLLHDKICIALPPKHLIDLLMQYDEHVTVYQILRSMNIYNKFPIEYGAPYPNSLITEIDNRIHELDKQYIKYNKKLA